MEDNKLTLNLSKTHYLIFNNEPLIRLNLNIKGVELEQLKETKYLGLIIQDNLKWDKQIQKIIRTLNAQIPLYYTLKEFLPQEKLNTIYKAISFSLINYGIELYGRKNDIWLKQLQKTQNRLLKILLRKPKLFSTNKLHRTAQILKVVDLSQLRLSLISHRVIHHSKNINITYQDMQLAQNIHRRNLRNNLNLQTSVNSYANKNKIIEHSSTIWNNLNYDLKQIKNRNTFKDRIQCSLIEQYN